MNLNQKKNYTDTIYILYEYVYSFDFSIVVIKLFFQINNEKYYHTIIDKIKF